MPVSAPVGPAGGPQPPESERTFAERPPGPVWRSEPFRLFFPLGVLLGWVGVGHWLLYGLGWTATYSCMSHGFVQMQAFLMSFALGFLLTALPRRTRSAPPSAAEMGVLAAALVATTVAAMLESWVLAEIAYASLFAVLLRFAVVRFRRGGGGRRPPAAFVLVPMAALHGLGGASLVLVAQGSGPPAWAIGLGTLMIEQGVFLCLVLGVGSLLLPLMAGEPPPADLGSSPRERVRLLAYLAAGLAIFASLVIEELGWIRGGPLLRAAVVAAGIGLGAGALRAPGRRGLHRRLVWLAVWLMPAGLALSAVWPDLRVAALHVLFIGGFGLMAFSVATHVSLAHLGLETLALGRPPAVVVLAAGFLAALVARLAADVSETYFEHLAWAAGIWIAASAVWLAFLGPKLLRPS